MADTAPGLFDDAPDAEPTFEPGLFDDAPDAQVTIGKDLFADAPDAKPVEQTTALGAAGRGAATQVLPAAGAGAGFVAGFELGAPTAPFTYGLGPLVTGGIG